MPRSEQFWPPGAIGYFRERDQLNVLLPGWSTNGKLEDCLISLFDELTDSGDLFADLENLPESYVANLLKNICKKFLLVFRERHNKAFMTDQFIQHWFWFYRRLHN